MKRWFLDAVRWVKETFVAEAELFEMHWRHCRHGEGYSDASYAIARRKMRWER